MLFGFTTQAQENKPKNVLFIIVDDLRPILPTYGANQVVAPNITAFAENAVQFNNAFDNIPILSNRYDKHNLISNQCFIRNKMTLSNALLNALLVKLVLLVVLLLLLLLSETDKDKKLEWYSLTELTSAFNTLPMEIHPYAKVESMSMVSRKLKSGMNVFL